MLLTSYFSLLPVIIFTLILFSLYLQTQKIGGELEQNSLTQYRALPEIKAETEISLVTANIREGYKRPSTKEYLDFLGYSQASLEEVRGDIEDAKDDGLLPSKPGSSLTDIGIQLKPHPYHLLKSPTISYDPLGELKRIIGDIKGEYLTYEIFLELINKSDYLLKRTVEGLQTKIVKDERIKLNQELETIKRRYW